MVQWISGLHPARAGGDEPFHAALWSSDLCEMRLGLVQFSADKLFAESNQRVWHGQAPQSATSA